MYVKATRLERGLYCIGYPEDYNPDDAILMIGSFVGQILMPGSYSIERREGNSVTYRIEGSVVAKLLDGGLIEIWATAPTPFLIQQVAKAGPGRPKKT